MEIICDNCHFRIKKDEVYENMTLMCPKCKEYYYIHLLHWSIKSQVSESSGDCGYNDSTYDYENNPDNLEAYDEVMLIKDGSRDI